MFILRLKVSSLLFNNSSYSFSPGLSPTYLISISTSGTRPLSDIIFLAKSSILPVFPCQKDINDYENLFYMLQ